jgi:hypothetical protein
MKRFPVSLSPFSHLPFSPDGVKGVLGGVMSFVEVLNPTADTRAQDLPLARRHGDLRGKTIGFLNNRKANAGLLLEKIEALLRARFGDFFVIKGEKNAAMPAPAAVMEKLSMCDLALVAIGD